MMAVPLGMPTMVRGLLGPHWSPGTLTSVISSVECALMPPLYVWLLIKALRCFPWLSQQSPTTRVPTESRTPASLHTGHVRRFRG